MTEDLQRRALDIWSAVLGTRAKAVNLRTGTLGDGAGNTTVTDRPSFSWIRFDASPNKVSIVYNKYQNWAEDTYVVVGKQHPDDPYDQVLWVNLAAYGLTIDTSTSAYYETAPHGETHLLGSTDPAWISTGNVVDGRINATNPYSMQVYVEEFLFVRECAIIRFVGDFIDLTGYVPTGLYSGSQHRYVLVYLDKQTTLLGAVSGDLVSTDDDPVVPAIPANSVPLGVVDISGLTTQITSSMVYPWKIIWDSVCSSDVGDHTHSADPGDGGESLIGFEELMTACAEPLYVVGGLIIPTNFYHELYLQDSYITGLYGNADLVSITPDPVNGCGQFLLLRPASPDLYASYTITLRHGVGNIWLAGGEDIILNEPTDHILLVYNGTWWCEVCSGNECWSVVNNICQTGNDVRIGEVTSYDERTPGYGKRLYMSGGPSWLPWDSENSDVLWMARYNVASDKTEWRVNIGDNSSPNDAYVFGYTDFATGEWTPLYRFEMGGLLYLVGDGTVFNDIICPFDPARVPAANAPTWSAFQGNLNAYTFAVGDYLEMPAELLHGYKSGSTIQFHIHWATNGLDGTDRAVNWEIEYTYANMDASDNVGDAFPATTIISAETTIPANTPDLTHMYTSIGTFANASGAIGQQIKFRIRRIAAAGTDPSNDPFGLQVGIHYEIDTIGSNTYASKT